MSDGWHDDPYGRYPKRYYDGTQWTQHVADHAGATQVDPMGTQPNPGAMPTAPPVGQMPAGYGVGPKKGSPVLRFLARLVDAIIIGLPLFFITDALFDYGDMFNFDTNGNGIETDVSFPVGALILQFAVFAVYEIYMIGNFGRTIGKMVCGVTVARQRDNAVPGYGVAAVRYVAGIVYAIPLIGWLLFIITVVMGFSDEKGRTIHDRIASTWVASTSSLKS